MRKNRIALLIAVFSLVVSSVGIARAQYVINTLAGGGPNNLPAASSSIGTPPAIALDSHGNLYFADRYSSRVFKVNPSGNLTVVAGDGLFVAGDGLCGYNGDGIPATQAELCLPDGLFVDGSGNIFIADTGNARIREVVAATGIIQTVAGDGTAGYNGDGIPATQAELFSPDGVFVDGSGNIFIADSDNHRIREVVAATGNIQTVAGDGTAGYNGDGIPATQAELNNGDGVFVDGSGNIFITDTGNERIREVVAATGDIQTVAGDGTGGYNGDGIPATQAELSGAQSVFVDGSGNIFIADAGNQRIREVAAATGNIQTVAGDGSFGYNGDGIPATQAELNSPFGVFLDGSGNIYIADYSNNRIREVVVATGSIQTVAGNGFLSYSGDGFAAIDADLSSPAGIAVDSSQNVFISDEDNNVVREVVAATGDIQTVAGNGTPGFSGDGGLASQAELNTPAGLAVDGSGNVYVADANNNRVRVVNTGKSAITLAGVTIQPGNISTIAGNGTYGYSGDNGPALQAEIAIAFGQLEGLGYLGGGVAVGSNGILYIADLGNNRIRALNTGTSPVTIAGVTIAPGNISTVAGNGTAGFSGDQGPATSAELNNPINVGVDASGNIYVADSGNSVVRAINPGTSTITVAGVSIPGGDIATVAGNGAPGYLGDRGPATQAELNLPTGVSVDSSGNIFISDSSNFVIREVGGSNGTLSGAGTGTIITIAGDNTLGFSGDGGGGINAELTDPVGIAVDSAGRVVFSDNEASRVRQLTPANCQTTHTLSGFTVNATVSCTGNFVQGNQNQFMSFLWGDDTQTVSGSGGGPNCGVPAGSCSFSASHAYTSSGTYTVTPTVTDASGTNIITTGFTVTVTVPLLSITTTSLPGGTVGTAYNRTVTATGGTTPYAWSVTAGSLAPLTLDSTTGVISGTPTTAGTLNFTVQVKDANAKTATQALSIVVSPAPPMVMTTSLPGGTINTAYTQTTLAASGGTPPYTWSVSTGSLPPGISVSAAGVVSGMPTVVGTFDFTIQVKDASGAAATQALSIAVVAPIGAPTCQPPTVQIDSSGTNPNPLSVTATSNCTDSTGMIASTTIDWGDGTAQSPGTSAPHTYTAAGTYSITVTATDTNNLSDSASGSVTVTAPLATPVMQGQAAQQTAMVMAPLGVPSVTVTYTCGNTINGPSGPQTLAFYHITSCTVSPPTVTLTSTPTQIQVTVQTTGATAELLRPGLRRGGAGPLYAALLVLPGIGLVGIGWSTKRRKVVRYAGLALLCVLLWCWLACGGGSSSMTQPTSNPTPLGSYGGPVPGTSSGGTTTSTITIGFTVS